MKPCQNRKKKATLPLKKKSKTTLRKRSSKTGFSLPATAFEISFDVFEQPFWLLLRHNSGEREDFVFCKLDDKYVSISCCLSQTPRTNKDAGEKCQQVQWQPQRLQQPPQFPSDFCKVLRTVLLITTRSHSFLPNCFLWQITTQIHKGQSRFPTLV